MTTGHDGRKPLDVDALLEIAGLRRPAWMADAACRGLPTAMFFPPRGSRSGETARRICASCPVVVECLEFGIEHEPLFGIWGDSSPKQRRAIRRRCRLAELEDPAA